MWDLPRPGLKPVSPALAGRFSTTAPPGKPWLCNFDSYKEGICKVRPKRVVNECIITFWCVDFLSLDHLWNWGHGLKTLTISCSFSLKWKHSNAFFLLWRNVFCNKIPVKSSISFFQLYAEFWNTYMFQCLFFFKNHFFRILLIWLVVQFPCLFSLNYWLR